MLHPCKKIDTAEYKDRDGSVVEAPDDANFFRREGAFVVMECQDKVLLVKPIDGRGYWELPGGGIDAVKRLNKRLFAKRSKKRVLN